MVAASDEVIRPIVALRVVNKRENTTEIVYALLDSGSECDVFSEKLTERLKAKKTWAETKIITVDSDMMMRRAFVDLSIMSVDGEYTAETAGALVGQLLTNEGDKPPSKRDLSAFTHLNDLEYEDFDAKVEVILGNHHDRTWMYITDEGRMRRGPEGQPSAICTSFGWTVSGSGGKRSENSITCHRIAIDDASLHRDVERIFYNDFPRCDESEMGLSRDQISAKRQLEESCRFDDDVKKYTVGIPWKAPREETRAIMNAANSEAMCLKRLRSTKAKFEKDPGLKERAFRQMEAFEKNGYAIDIVKQPGEKETKGIWYLPIHIVEEIRNGKLKTRICHDARASADGICLNELMLGGWNLINPLADICKVQQKVIKS